MYSPSFDIGSIPTAPPPARPRAARSPDPQAGQFQDMLGATAAPERDERETRTLEPPSSRDARASDTHPRTEVSPHSNPAGDESDRETPSDRAVTDDDNELTAAALAILDGADKKADAIDLNAAVAADRAGEAAPPITDQSPLPDLPVALPVAAAISAPPVVSGTPTTGPATAPGQDLAIDALAPIAATRTSGLPVALGETPTAASILPADAAPAAGKPSIAAAEAAPDTASPPEQKAAAAPPPAPPQLAPSADGKPTPLARDGSTATADAGEALPSQGRQTDGEPGNSRPTTGSDLPPQAASAQGAEPARVAATPFALIGPTSAADRIAADLRLATPTLPITVAEAGAAAVPIAGVAVEIAARALADRNRFEIRLDPPELGRIDVRLDVDRQGHVTSRLVVERAETLDLLRREASNIERTLEQAGLKTSDNSLQFSLRDQSAGTDRHDRGGAMANAARLVIADDTVTEQAAAYGPLLGRPGSLDIRV